MPTTQAFNSTSKIKKLSRETSRFKLVNCQIHYQMDLETLTISMFLRRA